MTTPLSPSDLIKSPVVQKFLNQKVEVTEYKRTTDIGGRPYTKRIVTLVHGDPTIAALRKAVEAEGYHLRTLTPGEPHTAEHRTDRLNAHIRKASFSSHYRIDGFGIG